MNITKREHWQETLVATDTHHIIWQKLTDDIFLSLTVNKDQGNLGMGRLQMQQLGKKVVNELP